jgi:hypothetical protein
LVGSGYWETIQRFHDTLQAAIARVTPAILRCDAPYPSRDSVGRLYLSEPKAPLGGLASQFALSIGMRFRIEPAVTGDDRWEIQSFAYS